MDEQLGQLLREVILTAIAKHIDPKPVAEHAAKAFKAGMAAFREKTIPSGVQPQDP